MARTMQTFVDLIGHACAQPLPQERRAGQARRTHDQQVEACLFD
jgi:septin family protein